MIFYTRRIVDNLWETFFCVFTCDYNSINMAECSFIVCLVPSLRTPKSVLLTTKNTAVNMDFIRRPACIVFMKNHSLKSVFFYVDIKCCLMETYDIEYSLEMCYYAALCIVVDRAWVCPFWRELMRKSNEFN